MAEYRVSVVSQNPPRQWSFKDKTTGADVHMETHKVKLDGVEGPVEINKKPGATIAVGEVLNGTLETNDFSGEGWKFKADKKAPGGFGGGRDQPAIIAEWAIGQALQVALAFAAKPSDLKMEKVEAQAIELKAMMERVKEASGSTPMPAANAASVRVVTAAPQADEVIDIGDEPINLDDIPF